MENMLTEIFKEMGIKAECQVKEVMDLGDFKLVVKPDYVFKNKVIEVKYPFSIVKDEIPERYKYQLEAEYRAFFKQVYLGVLTSPFHLRLIPFTPSRRRWNNIKVALQHFHEELTKQEKLI